jgi:cyclic beta-1,2-glucan synthetase
VSDPCGEVIYLTDVANEESWSATPAPANADTLFTVRHAHGCSVFAHERSGINTTLVVGMPERDAVKLSLLRIENKGSTARRIRITSYTEWTLGALREVTQHHVRTFYDHESGLMCAENYFDRTFANMTAFAGLSEPVASYTGDRREFVGRNGNLSNPEALKHPHLSDATGAGLDPCAAMEVTVELQPGQVHEVAIMLGAAKGVEEARKLASKYSTPQATRAALDANVAAWKRRLTTVNVKTPSSEFDTMVNGWLLYQALACRFWGRSALYQSSGAYGFRDQLQDVLAFLHAEPQLAREHILRAASRQFTEGDVQHWWHPHTGRGVRTKFSDDLVWLPFVVEGYVTATGDESVLDEQAPFLQMRELKPEEHEVYDLPQVSPETASVFEHCMRALRRAATRGVHGLPLIGIGDWNDGMSRVGVEGKGESVWLAWFLADTMRKFAPICSRRGDEEGAAWLLAEAESYIRAVEDTSWDGAWYRRAYFDDGTPLGSSANPECRIDSIAQSWSIISGGGSAERTEQAMKSLREHLMDEDARLIRLLTPAFDEAPYDPGYIKGYLPGVRENGAQYTHAALWAVMATAMRGNGDEAFRMFQMINPMTHSRTPEEVATYMVEPYVVAADVYTAEGHVGRGGWTWYTGSASWMYRVALESIIGLHRRGNTLVLDPCIPSEWDEYVIEYRWGETRYTITIRNPDRVNRGIRNMVIDGEPGQARPIRLDDDGAWHSVEVELGAGAGVAN